jgi:DNA polymerase-3 subunit gamma/tau
MDAASNRGIDEVRDMIERAAYKPTVGRFKVFMIDEAHQLTKEAFSALLKTLEEPPDYLKFVLATTDPEKMLPTVLSRCLQFNLRPMAPDTVRSHLQHVLTAEAVAHDDGALRLLARAARGSMRDALSLTDQAIAYGAGRIDEPLVRAMLGVTDRHVPLELLRCLAARDGAALLARIGALREGGVSCDATLEQMALLLQQAAVEQAVPGALPVDDEEAEGAREIASAMTAEELQLLYSLVLNGRSELALLSDTTAAFTMVLLRYLAFPPVPTAVPAAPRAAPLRVPDAQARLRVPVPPAVAVTPAPVVVSPSPAAAAVPAAAARPGATAPEAAPEAAPRAVSHAAAPAAPPVAADTGLADRWDRTARQLAERGLVSGLVRELVWQSTPAAFDASPPAWTLVNAHEALRSTLLRDKLAAALSELDGRSVALTLVAGQPQDTPAQRDAAEKQRRQRAAEQAIQQDPVVLDLLSQFETARIVPGSVKPL